MLLACLILSANVCSNCSRFPWPPQHASRLYVSANLAMSLDPFLHPSLLLDSCLSGQRHCPILCNAECSSRSHEPRLLLAGLSKFIQRFQFIVARFFVRHFGRLSMVSFSQTAFMFQDSSSARQITSAASNRASEPPPGCRKEDRFFRDHSDIKLENKSTHSVPSSYDRGWRRLFPFYSPTPRRLEMIR